MKYLKYSLTAILLSSAIACSPDTDPAQGSYVIRGILTADLTVTQEEQVIYQGVSVFNAFATDNGASAMFFGALCVPDLENRQLRCDYTEPEFFGDFEVHGWANTSEAFFRTVLDTGAQQTKRKYELTNVAFFDDGSITSSDITTIRDFERYFNETL